MKKENELLANAKLTSKGQITIPKKVRTILNIEEGDSLLFYLDENNNVKIANMKDCKVEPDSYKQQVIVKRGKNNE